MNPCNCLVGISIALGACAAPALTGGAVPGPSLAAQPGGEYLVDWLICGEFPDPDTGGLDIDYLTDLGGEPLATPTRGATQTRPDGSVAEWFPYHAGQKLGAGPQIRFKPLFSVARPTSEVVAYAYTTFTAEAGPAFLALGSCGGLRVWLNGEEVHSKRDSKRLLLDDDLVPITLRDGLNRLLVKIAAGERGWAFALRVADARQAEPQPEDGDIFLRHARPKHSAGREDVIIRHFFAGHPPGIFVDVGCGHPKVNNNTYYLESAWGWSGVAVDALEEFAPKYQTARPRTQFFAYLVGDTNAGSETFYRSDNTLLSSTSKDWVEAEGGQAAVTEIAVPWITLTKLLDDLRIERITLLTMDIELGEPSALAGFDIDRFRPELVCIEAQDQVSREIADYFARHRYERVHEYLAFDQVNWYFKPMPTGP